ncbi:MAG: amino acid permease [Candidatus Aminicenantes bacterium]|nr:amino acid permease [Candidatus Aminicenantes bacterium]
MNIWKTKTPAQIVDAAEHTPLKKNLSAFDLAALGIGSVVGAGIFAATGEGALKAGPGIIVAFVITAITCGFCALTYSELACMFPVAGSTYSYSYVAFGEVIAWIIGWDLMLEYLVSASAVASAWSGTFRGVLITAGITPPDSLMRTPFNGGIIDLPAVVLTLGITWILYIGIRESAKINNIIVAVKIIVILLFIFLGASHVDLANFRPLAPFGFGGIMAGAAIIFFSFIGFDAVSTAAEETRNPQRDVPRGLMICLGVVIVLYVAVAFVLTGIVPFREISVDNALPGALSRIGIRWGSVLVAIGGIVGMVSTLLVTLYGQIRIFMVMARDGLLPPAFAKVHPKHRTPHLCTWITGIATALIAGFFPLDKIIMMCNIGTLFAFVLVSIGVIVLRKTQPQLERKFKTPWVPFTPLVTIGLCFWLMYRLGGITWVRFGIWLLAGLLIYFVYSARHSKLQKAA